MTPYPFDPDESLLLDEDAWTIPVLARVVEEDNIAVRDYLKRTGTPLPADGEPVDLTVFDIPDPWEEP